ANKLDIQKIEKLKLTLEKYKGKIKEKDELIQNLTSNKNQTNFVSAEVKKRELLEDKIEKLYRIIEDTKNIAKDATMMKSDFLSSIKEEVRTPLSSIVVFAQLLYKEITDKRHKGFASDILSSSSTLLELLDNVIELSKIKSDSIKIDEKAVDMNEFFKLNIGIFKEDIIKKDLSLEIDIDKDMPKILILDQVRVANIFNNLLSNAINFTKEGFIKIIVKIEEVNVVNNLVDISISVEDSGVGISEINQKKIFEVFETKEDNNDVQYQGRGIELSVNKKLAQLMNGDLEVRSELSKGSTFTLTLKDVEMVLSSDDNHIDEVDFSLIKSNGATILVIDDVKENCEIIRDSFAHTSTEVLTFDNARDSIELLMKQKVDLIFIDIDIFSVDEGAIAKVIKTVSDAFVVILTDKRIKGIVFADSGAKPIGYLKKPISKIELFKISLKIFNIKENNSVKKSIKKVEQVSEFFKDIDIQDLKSFLKIQETKLTKLYQEAISTNDLKTIKLFSTSLLELSLKHRIQSMVDYGKILLQKVDSFEINEINEMLKSYKIMIERLEKYVKDRTNV
ncbi:MAG: response regulator, partial [Epsilonproteobacteria bacterium]|nr:response regulator [Campylobacterota bacterium]